MNRRDLLLLLCCALLPGLDAVALADFDIVYVRAPRFGDNVNTKWPEVKDPIRAEPGTDLMLLHPDGSEEVLVAGGDGAVVDPCVSFDGQWVFYSKFPDMRPQALNPQRRAAPLAGADIFKINLQSRETVRLTHQEWTPNLGAAPWSNNPLTSEPSGTFRLGYGIFNLGACPLPGGRVVFTSSRNGFLPNKSFTFPNLQIFVMDEDGRNVEPVGHMNLGSALHPSVLSDGRVMFSSYEAQGLRDPRLWGLWSIWPDGRRFQPLMSALLAPNAYHFQTELSDGRIVVTEYYNQNNNGFGTLLAFDPEPADGAPPFGNPVANHASNPAVRRGLWFFQPGHPSHLQPRFKQYPFSPPGLHTLTGFAHGEDNAASRDVDGGWAGKVTHPSAAPENALLLVWSPGPANNLNRPTPLPYYDGGIYLLADGQAVNDHQQLLLIKNDAAYNEMQPRAVVPYRAIYGKDEPDRLEWLPNDGRRHAQLAAGTPFGLVGTSTFYRRNSKPGIGDAGFDGLDPFNTSENGASSNWESQGADAGKYGDEDIFALRILAMEPSSHLSYGPAEGRSFFNHANERLRILGEIPLRKLDADQNVIVDADGNPDTSFLARIPADVPFTFQTLDRDGLALNMAQTWHQVRPGEARYDCGGCHAHAQLPLAFEQTYAARAEYTLPDLTRQTPLLTKNAQGEPVIAVQNVGAVDVEYHRDIKPILERSCVACHSLAGPAEAGLVLDDNAIVAGYDNTYNRLARDEGAQYGLPPVISNGTWRQTNASRYIRKFQSRRSLLIWKLFGRRLDGWDNADHPTESQAGDASTLPAGSNANEADIDYTGSIMPPSGSAVPALSEAEKILFARWVDLGAPITSQAAQRIDLGWFADDLRPTLFVATRPAAALSPAWTMTIGAFDYYSGLDRNSLSIVADISVNGLPAGAQLAGLASESDHVWTMAATPGRSERGWATFIIRIDDNAGNATVLARSVDIPWQRTLRAGINALGFAAGPPAGLGTCKALYAALGGSASVARIEHLDPSSGVLQACDSNGGEDFSIEPTVGYIVHMHEPRTIGIPASRACENPALAAGVNLVAHPRPQAGLGCFAMLAAQPAGVSAMQRFESIRGVWETCVVDQGKVSGIDFEVEAGDAYFVHSRVATELNFCR